jgi:hypothetical protein
VDSIVGLVRGSGEKRIRPKHQNQNVHVQDWDVVIVSRSLFVKLVGKIMNIKSK